jgi:dihydroorotate dehydrogenase
MDFYALVRPLLEKLDPETAHRLALLALRRGLVSLSPSQSPTSLHQKLWGLDFINPVGLAAGFDKNAEALAPLMKLGFGFLEAGTLTPLPQAGNARPRLFRLKDDKAVINRMGFNNIGITKAAKRLAELRMRNGLGLPIGLNIGANRNTADPAADYDVAMCRLYDLADYLVVNISSPNTPGLRDLQAPARVTPLIERLVNRRATLAGSRKIKPLLLKIAPDMRGEEACALADIACAHGIDGLIISNTTVSRPALASPQKNESGGLSGKPLFVPSTRLLAQVYLHTGKRLPLVGVGGIASADDAYEKIRAGAALVQFYSALVFQGPSLVGHIVAGLAQRLHRDNIHTIAALTGRGAKEWAAIP